MVDALQFVAIWSVDVYAPMNIDHEAESCRNQQTGEAAVLYTLGGGRFALSVPHAREAADLLEHALNKPNAPPEAGPILAAAPNAIIMLRTMAAMSEREP